MSIAFIYLILALLSSAISPLESVMASAPNTPSPTTEKEKLSAGVFANQVPGPRIYENVAALTFEFQLPSNPDNSFMVFDYGCPDSKFSTEYSCPIFYYLHKIRDQLKPFMNLDHLRHPESDPDGDHDPEPFRIPSCDELSRHFTTTTISSNKLQRYQSLLRACVDSLIVRTPIDLRFNQTGPNHNVLYSLMVHGFVESYFKLLPDQRRVDKAILLNALTVNNALGFNQYIQEAQLWTDAATACSAQNIPAAFIPPRTLQNGLEKLEKLFLGKNIQLVIPSGNRSLAEYYKAPLTDCVMTRHTFFVRILVPIKKVESQWKIIQLTPVPFLLDDGEDKTRLVCAVKEFESLYTFDKVTGNSYPLSQGDCDLKRDTLCHSGDRAVSLKFYRKSCASEFLQFQKSLQNIQSQADANNNNTSGGGSRSRSRSRSKPTSSQRRGKSQAVLESEQMQMERALAQDVIRECELHCQSAALYNTPIVIKVASNKFYIAGQANESLVVNCQNRVELIHPPEEGVLEVTLPCYCSIMYKNRKFISQEPCSQGTDKEMKIMRVKPIHLAPPVRTEIDGGESDLDLEVETLASDGQVEAEVGGSASTGKPSPRL